MGSSYVTIPHRSTWGSRPSAPGSHTWTKPEDISTWVPGTRIGVWKTFCARRKEPVIPRSQLKYMNMKRTTFNFQGAFRNFWNHGTNRTRAWAMVMRLLRLPEPTTEPSMLSFYVRIISDRNRLRVWAPLSIRAPVQRYLQRMHINELCFLGFRWDDQ